MFTKMRRLREISLFKVFILVGIITFLKVVTPYEIPIISDNPAQANVATGTQDFTRDRKLFKSVTQQVNQKRYTRALKQAQKIDTTLMREIALWLVLSSNVGSKSIGDFETLNHYISEPTNWPRQGNLKRNAESNFPDTISPEAVLEWFKKSEPSNLSGIVRYVSVLEITGKKLDAKASVQNFWRKITLGKSDEQDFLKKFKNNLTAEDHIKRLDFLIWNKFYVGANRQLPRVPKNYRALGKARIALLRRKGNVDALINKVPSNLKQDTSLVYARAKWRLSANKNDETIELLDPPLPDAREPEKWWPLRHWAVRKILIKKDYEKAYRIASAHGMSRGVGFAEGEWLTGWISLQKLGMPRRAYTHFYQLYNGVKSPISKARAAYWAGRAAKDIGHLDWAEKWFTIAATFQTTFYGQLAGYELGKTASIVTLKSSAISPGQKISFYDKKIVRSIQLLKKLGEENLVITFLTRLRLDSKTREDYIQAANLAKQIGHQNIALRTAKSARQKGILLPDLLYPNLSIKTPQTSNAEPALILALIRQESEFNQNAISRAGARGLMQLMPATAKLVARQQKVKYKKQKLTNDPSYNVKLGTAYLSDLIGAFNGSYIMALAGYNAGPSRVKKWIKDYGDPRDQDVDVIDWIEQIPFNETRNYVQRILESHQIYRGKLNPKRTTISAKGNLPYSLWGHPNSGS